MVFFRLNCAKMKCVNRVKSLKMTVLSGKFVQNKNLQIAQKMAILGYLEVDLGNFSSVFGGQMSKRGCICSLNSLF